MSSSQDRPWQPRGPGPRGTGDGEQEAEDEVEGTGRHGLASEALGGGSPCQKERKMTDLTMKNLRTGL